jgi:hypothetical protein
MLENILHWIVYELPSCFAGGKTITPKARGVTDTTTEEARENRAASYFKHKKFVQYLSGIIQSALAAAIPGLSVLALYKVHNLQDRIFVLIGLTVAFAIIVKAARGVTREIDIFSVTAA